MSQFVLPFAPEPSEATAPPKIDYGKHFIGRSLENPPVFSLGRNDDFSALVTQKAAKRIERAFCENISAGKNTYVYDAHTYHTKVPPAGIKRLIEYYTDAGQTVLDPFCGSGMTGVAALECGRKGSP